MTAPRDDRPYDVVLLGATGFAGKLTADYLARSAPAGTRVGNSRSQRGQAGGGA